MCSLPWTLLVFAHVLLLLTSIRFVEQTPKSLSEYMVPEVREALQASNTLPKPVGVGLDVEVDTCAGRSVSDMRIASPRPAPNWPSTHGQVEGGEALVLEPNCVPKKEEEREAVSNSEASGTWQHSEASERLLSASMATLEDEASEVQEEGGGSKVGDVSFESTQLSTAPSSAVLDEALGAEEVRRAERVEIPGPEEGATERGRESTAPGVDTPLVEEDTLNSGETLVEEEETGRVIFSDESQMCSPCPSVSAPADVDGAGSEKHVEAAATPRAHEDVVCSVEEAVPATPVAMSLHAVAVVMLQCAVRGWMARRNARTLVLDNFAQATPARVFRLCQSVNQRIQDRQHEHALQSQEAQQQHMDAGKEHQEQQEQELQQQTRRQRRRAAMRLQRQQKEQQSALGESLPTVSPDSMAPVATTQADEQGSSPDLEAGGAEAAAPAVPQASAAAPIVATPEAALAKGRGSASSASTLEPPRTDAGASASSQGLHSPTRSSVGTQASRKRDIEMRLLLRTPQEVQSQLAPRCLFPTSPLLSGAAINRRLSLSGKKTKKQKPVDEIATQIQAEIESEPLDVPTSVQAHSQASADAHEQTCTERTQTPVKVECGAQTDAHRPGSRTEAPHTPAEKRSFMSFILSDAPSLGVRRLRQRCAVLQNRRCCMRTARRETDSLRGIGCLSWRSGSHSSSPWMLKESRKERLPDSRTWSNSGTEIPVRHDVQGG